MKPAERNAVIRILELLIASSAAAVKRVPAAFQPPEIKKNLAEASDLLARMKDGEFDK